MRLVRLVRTVKTKKMMLVGGAVALSVAQAAEGRAPIDYVNPLIGTASRRADTGNSAGMMPYVCPPFAAVEWVPMTRLSEVGILSFAAPDRKFLGFVGSRQPAIWMGEWGQLSVAPQITERPVCDYRVRGLEIDKANCVYTPHYAKVVTREGVVAIGASFRPATFTIIARNQAKANYVVKSVKLNGIELKERRIRHSDIVKGGTLEFEMSAPQSEGL